MKTIFFLCAVAITSPLLAQTTLTENVAASSALASGFAAVSWDESRFDFGTIDKGVPVTHTFNFTNTGTVPLLIQRVETTCGCTVTAYTKDPVPPGGTGSVSATYNAAKSGVFVKTLTVRANMPSSVQLVLSGSVSDSQ